MQSQPLRNNSHGQNFQYDSLEGPRYVRLLRVFSRTFSGRIFGEFAYVPLQDSPSVPLISYEAISYCWGDPSPADRIWFSDNRYLDITQSAADVLRFIIKSKTKGYLWIDAICINQIDLEEKNRQIRLMRDIYASARQVIVWLGRRASNSDLAMKFIRSLNDKIDKQVLEIQKGFRGIGAVSILGNESSPEWIALRALLDRDWFRRLWTLQEIVVGSRAIIATGDKRVSWISLVKILDQLHVSGTLGAKYLGLHLPDYSRFPIGVQKMVIISNICCRIQSLNSYPLQKLLIECRPFSASDPRDKIFAVLGLAKDSADAGLDPNYASSPRKVFTQSSRYLIIRDQSLDILHAAGVGWDRLLDDLPSWVPDWSVDSRCWDEYSGCKFNDILLRRIRPSNLDYRLGGSPRVTSPEDAVSSNPGSVIIIRATVFDHLVEIGPHANFIKSSVTELDFQSAYTHFIERLHPYPTGENLDHIRWLLQICNFSYEARGHPGPEYSTYYQNYLTIHQLRTGKMSQEGLTDSDIQEIKKGANKFQLAFNLFREFCFFSSSAGYAGRGPPKIAKGDKICIFHGAATPFIIRPYPRVEGEEPTYALVGECYVHGIMYGEGIDEGIVENIRLR